MQLESPTSSCRLLEADAGVQTSSSITPGHDSEQHRMQRWADDRGHSQHPEGASPPEPAVQLSPY